MSLGVQRVHHEAQKDIFSYDRPIQLQGLCQSILDNTDLQLADIWCLCRSSSASYQAAYHMVGRELGVRIVDENRVVPGIDLRQLYQLATRLPRGRRAIAARIYRLTTPTSLPQRVLELTNDVDYLSLAVDDMVYYHKSTFALATSVLADNPDVCLWSWRIDINRYPRPEVFVQDAYWMVSYEQLPIPYGYVFHTDGSVFRRGDLERWLDALPKSKTLTLNMVEGELWKSFRREPGRFKLGPLHAGSLRQTCVTWQINRVSPTAVAKFHAALYSDPLFLRQHYQHGARLDYSALYGRDEWLTQLNGAGADVLTHVAATQEAVEMWYSMVKNPQPK